MWRAAAWMAAWLVPPAAAALVGGRRLLRGRDIPEPLGASIPRVSVVAPVGGVSSGTIPCLRSLLAQDYPAFEVVLAAEASDGAAADVVEAILRECAGGRVRVRSVTAGPARSCGQKNLNLLAAVAATDPDSEVLVFCDAGHEAPPHWLRALVAPLAAGQAEVATGYHHVVPAGGYVASSARAIGVLLAYAMQKIPALSQPWGGATAIRRALFDRLRVADEWAGSVVDDVSLAVLLRRARVRLCSARGASLITRPGADTFGRWAAWLTRQIVYLKFYFPASWAAVSAYACALAAVTGLAALACVTAAVRVAPAALGCAGAVFLAAQAGLLLALRVLHPAPGSRFTWLAGGFAAVFVGAWCAAATWRTGTIEWQGLRYEVARGGRVTAVRRPEGPPRPAVPA